MTNNRVIIIGAGATGLMAARELTKAGKNVTVLEARNRCGGRIHTLKNQLFFKPVELGAEFVHGDLPVTLNLLREADIKYHAAGGDMLYHKKGKFDTGDSGMPGWGLLIKRLNGLKEDKSIHDFLTTEFPGDQYEGLRDSVERFAAGYDTADPRKASAFALRNEWQNEDEGAQYRISGGYGAMINYLENECRHYGGMVNLNSVVKNVQWQPGLVKAVTEEGKAYEAEQLLVALPLGVLQAPAGDTGTISFEPELSRQKDALQDLGFGAIIKILLEFDEIFWEDEHTTRLAGKNLNGMAFFISDEEIPTWWTQAPQHSPLLTGWLGGPKALAKKGLTDEAIIGLSLSSLSQIFKRETDWLRNKLVAFAIVNWTNEPFTRGSYAYDTVSAPAARKLLGAPVNGTLYFAGEYLYEGPAMGTVEAALTSGMNAANLMMNVHAHSLTYKINIISHLPTSVGIR